MVCWGEASAAGRWRGEPGSTAGDGRTQRRRWGREAQPRPGRRAVWDEGMGSRECRSSEAHLGPRRSWRSWGGRRRRPGRCGRRAGVGTVTAGRRRHCTARAALDSCPSEASAASVPSPAHRPTLQRAPTSNPRAGRSRPGGLHGKSQTLLPCLRVVGRGGTRAASGGAARCSCDCPTNGEVQPCSMRRAGSNPAPPQRRVIERVARVEPRARLALGRFRLAISRRMGGSRRRCPCQTPLLVKANGGGAETPQGRADASAARGVRIRAGCRRAQRVEHTLAATPGGGVGTVSPRESPDEVLNLPQLLQLHVAEASQL